jgi:hypothetical protein
MQKRIFIRNGIKFAYVLIVFLTGLLSIIGCAAGRQWSASPGLANNQFFKATVSPITTDSGWINPSTRKRCTSFDIEIRNHTNQNLELIWDKTLYIQNGKTSGGFMFEGVVFKDRNNPKPPDIIFPNDIFQKTIWPNILVSFVSGQYGSAWVHDNMTPGEVGVYLTIRVDGKEINEKIVTQLKD